MDGVFQKYNSGNKCWVKMLPGKVLDNRKEKFEGVPVIGGAETEEPMPPPKKEPEPEAPQTPDSDSVTFFEF